MRNRQSKKQVHIYDNFNDLDRVVDQWLIVDRKRMDVTHDLDDNGEMPDDTCLMYNGSNVMYRELDEPLLDYSYRKFTVGFDVSFKTNLMADESEWKVAINLYKETAKRDNQSVIDPDDWWLSFHFTRLERDPRFMIYLYSGELSLIKG